jgi:hypothetical protein
MKEIVAPLSRTEQRWSEPRHLGDGSRLVRPTLFHAIQSHHLLSESLRGLPENILKLLRTLFIICIIDSEWSPQGYAQAQLVLGRPRQRRLQLGAQLAMAKKSRRAYEMAL